MPRDRPQIEYLGLAFDSLSAEMILAELAERKVDSEYGYLVTPNVDHIVRLHQATLDQTDIVAAYREAKWCVCDSRVVSLLAKRSGLSLPVVTGSDLTRSLLETVCVEGDVIAVVGMAHLGLQRLAERYPHLTFRHHEPPFGLRYDCAAQLQAAIFVEAEPARFTLVAVGSPQQELVSHLIFSRARASGTALCIGASLDFIIGDARRAPTFIQRLALEWAYRLIQEPRRLWRRYLVDGPRIFRLAHQHRARRRKER